MNTLAEAVDDYVSLRQGLGFKLTQVERLLKTFAAFMYARDKSWVTIDLALSWAVQPVNGQPDTWAKRLAAVRGFALYRSATDARTEIPDQALLPNRRRRAKPYLYSDTEIANLLAAACAMKSDRGLRGQTYCCLLGLLAVSGLRISEALGLQNQDVNLEQGWLTIRRAKFGKSRLIPLHQSTRDVLGRYAKRRDAECPRPVTNKFFRSEEGTALSTSAVRRTFRHLAVQTGLRGPEDRKGPRLHDFRHNSEYPIIPSGFAATVTSSDSRTFWWRPLVLIARHNPAVVSWRGLPRLKETDNERVESRRDGARWGFQRCWIDQISQRLRVPACRTGIRGGVYSAEG